MSKLLLVTNDGPVRILTMNRPDKLNALNTELTSALVEALEAADRDDAVRAVVLTGAGRGFCAGADLKEFANLTADHPQAVHERADLTYRLQSLLPKLRKVVVVAARGAAVGGGAGLVAGADLAVASETLKFGYPELAHDIVAALVMTGLTRAMGRKQAFELLAMRRLLTASEALAAGVVNAVVKDDELMPTALRMAHGVASPNPVAMQATKDLFYRVAELDYDEAMRAGRDLNIIMRSFRSVSPS